MLLGPLGPVSDTGLEEEKLAFLSVDRRASDEQHVDLSESLTVRCCAETSAFSHPLPKLAIEL